jgi:hypothetical protein
MGLEEEKEMQPGIFWGTELNTQDIIFYMFLTPLTCLYDVYSIINFFYTNLLVAQISVGATHYDVVSSSTAYGVLSVGLSVGMPLSNRSTCMLCFSMIFVLPPCVKQMCLFLVVCTCKSISVFRCSHDLSWW